MTCQRFLLIGVICLSSTGCFGVYNALRVNVYEPRAFCVGKERKVTFKRNRELARWAWAQVVESDPNVWYSKDYMDGFLDGYADYLNLGGTGAAPPIPPRRYWNARYKTPDGQAAIQDWYAGFEHGAAEASQSGFRELQVVPISALLPVEAGPPAPYPGVIPAAPEMGPVEAILPEPTPAPLSQPAPEVGIAPEG